MTKIIKDLLGVSAVIVVLALGYAALSYVDSYSKMIQPSSFRSFSVTSDAKITSIPDVAEFSFQVITEGGNDMTSLQTKNTDTTNKAIAFIKSKGVEDKDIKTEAYNVNPRYETSNCGIIPYSVTGGQTIKSCPPPSIVGYTITQSVNIKVRDFTKIGDIIGGVVKNGANQVGALSFTIDDPTIAQNQARTEAMIKARTKAESIAKTGGFSVGRLLGIQEGSQYPVYNDQFMMKATRVSSESAPTPIIQPGSQEVSVSVTLQYEIK